tara:strand:- start:321 stop:620 length:300 start_codon:yes stop_codon:yes gene_type:complete
MAVLKSAREADALKKKPKRKPLSLKKAGAVGEGGIVGGRKPGAKKVAKKVGGTVLGGRKPGAKSLKGVAKSAVVGAVTGAGAGSIAAKKKRMEKKKLKK